MFSVLTPLTLLCMACVCRMPAASFNEKSFPSLPTNITMVWRIFYSLLLRAATYAPFYTYTTLYYDCSAHLDAPLSLFAPRRRRTCSTTACYRLIRRKI